MTNEVNGKQYVGTTKYSLSKRFKEHCSDGKRDRCKNRPLYADMNKYGFDKFNIEELEECDDNDRFDREIYWIEKLDTHNNGYNFTYGGAGKQFYDYKDVANKYLELGTVDNVCKFYNCDSKTVRVACEEHNITILSTPEHNKALYSKPIVMLDKINDALLRVFNTARDAGRYLGDERKRQHITSVCNGERATAYGYKWRWLKDYEEEQLAI